LITVRRYEPADKKAWNNFIRQSKNATFLFERDFMDYHADRFDDHSLLIFDKGKLQAVMAVNAVDKSVISHGGLSYGGLLLGMDVHLEEVLRFFFHAMSYLHAQGFTDMIYKCVPSHLMRVPSFEDQYAMFLMNAVMVRRDVSCVYSREQSLPFRVTRRNSIKKGLKKGFRIVRTASPSAFWRILETTLRERHGVTPTHSLDEISLLMSRFPKQIHCFEIHGKELLGGSVVFETATTAHAQYISANEAGRKAGALDILFQKLILNTFSQKSYFSFGHSNENAGRTLNIGLNSWKEGFGARVFTLDTYRIATANYLLLSTYA
jgi:hypothetical protein